MRNIRLNEYTQAKNDGKCYLAELKYHKDSKDPDNYFHFTYELYLNVSHGDACAGTKENLSVSCRKEHGYQRSLKTVGNTGIFQMLDFERIFICLHRNMTGDVVEKLNRKSSTFFP